jgi:hypothetical protein
MAKEGPTHASLTRDTRESLVQWRWPDHFELAHVNPEIVNAIARGLK